MDMLHTPDPTRPTALVNLAVLLAAMPVGPEAPSITHHEVKQGPDRWNVYWRLVHNFVPGSDEVRLEAECYDAHGLYWDLSGTKGTGIGALLEAMISMAVPA